MVTAASSETILLSGWLLGELQATGVRRMDEVRYAVRVRGRPHDAAAAASQTGMDVATDPVRTVLCGWLPDQAALLGILARARLLGLELVEVRRLVGH
jgi:hypothetical protein